MSADWVTLLAALVLLWAGVLFTTRGRAGAGGKRRKLGQSAEAFWMERLLRLTRGNRDAIERGVSARRAKFPQASRAELLELLYHDYLRDRR